MNHKQNGGSSRLVLNCTNRVPALFSSHGIDAVTYDQAKLVLEDKSGHLERDSIVGPLVSLVLCFVPFVAHAVYTQCITGLADYGSGSGVFSRLSTCWVSAIDCFSRTSLRARHGSFQFQRAIPVFASCSAVYRVEMRRRVISIHSDDDFSVQSSVG